MLNSLLNFIKNHYFIIIIIVILLTIIYSCHFTDTDTTNRTNSYKFLSKSSGINDTKSKSAKQYSSKIKKKTSKDHFLTTRVEHLNEHNNKITDTVINGYTNTLQRLINENPNDVTTVGKTNANDPNIPTRDFIINAIDTVNEQLRPIVIDNFDEERFIFNDFTHNNDVNHTNDINHTNDVIVFNFVRLADQVLPIVRKQSIAELKHQAKNVSENKEQAISHYLEQSKTHTNDPQNTHDTQVNTDIKHTFDLIANDSIDFNKAKPEIIKFITNSTLSQTDKHKAIKTLEHISKHNRHVTVLNGNEQDTLSRVWGRTYAKGNEDNSNDMKINIIKALADSVENGAVLCPNGVTSRLLEAPVLLDKNENVGKINTFETVKNMIFDKAHLSIKQEIENAKKSNNEKLSAVGMYYENPDLPVDTTALKQFESDLKNKLDNILAEETKAHHITPHNMDIIRTQLHAAI